ncbi:unnamed protein product [Phytophthora fragariaefolia]|uniref:Unnamed protein product n=1 Tax=Phytophthora fragariaefolia TaxID=1490495 RepID=A0A9W6XVM8_9STRA|nr:unnamed protein product [Phytophthora fragariaefolia]
MMKNIVGMSKSLQAMWKCSALVRCSCMTSQMAGNMVTFTVSWFLFLTVTAPFVADLLLVHIRGMRFTFEAITEQKDDTEATRISREEGYLSAAVLIIVAKVFAIIRTKASWAKLTCWDPTKAAANLILSQVNSTTSKSTLPSKIGAKVTDKTLVKSSSYVEISLNDDTTDTFETSECENEEGEALLSSSKTDPKLKWRRLGIRLAVVSFVLVIFPAIVVALSRASSPLIAYAALNTSLDEMLANTLRPTQSNGTPFSG